MRKTLRDGRFVKQGAKAILNSCNIRQVNTDKDRADIALTYKCLSLKDFYWVKKESDKDTGESVNLFDNKRITNRMLELSELMRSKEESSLEYSFLLDGLKYQITSYAESFCNILSIMNYSDFDTAEKRHNYIISLQEHLGDVFGYDNYNVFIFGSFTSMQFGPSSDLDIGIYTKDPVLQVSIADEILQFTNDKIDVDIIYIHDDSNGAFINLEALLSDVRFTDYFPPELGGYAAGLLMARIWRNEEHEFFRLRFPKIGPNDELVYEPTWIVNETK